MLKTGYPAEIIFRMPYSDYVAIHFEPLEFVGRSGTETVGLPRRVPTRG